MYTNNSALDSFSLREFELFWCNLLTQTRELQLDLSQELKLLMTQPGPLVSRCEGSGWGLQGKEKCSAVTFDQVSGVKLWNIYVEEDPRCHLKSIEFLNTHCIELEKQTGCYKQTQHCFCEHRAVSSSSFTFLSNPDQGFLWDAHFHQEISGVCRWWQ